MWSSAHESSLPTRELSRNLFLDYRFTLLNMTVIVRRVEGLEFCATGK
jgi:hypothetical protein